MNKMDISDLAVWYKFKNNFVYNENRLEGLDIDPQTVAEIITDLRLNKQIVSFTGIIFILW